MTTLPAIPQCDYCREFHLEIRVEDFIGANGFPIAFASRYVAIDCPRLPYVLPAEVPSGE